MKQVAYYFKMETYSPDNLFDFIKEEFLIKSDMELAQKLGIEASVLYAYRSKYRPMGDMIILRIHDKFCMTTNYIRELAGIPMVEDALN